MMPVKSHGSSRSKGKEVVSDDLAMQDVGKKATYSELNRFDEEEARLDLDSECAPFIDPWYDTHAHFLKVPGEYMSPPPGCMWLALYRRNTDIS